MANFEVNIPYVPPTPTPRSTSSTPEPFSRASDEFGSFSMRGRNCFAGAHVRGNSMSLREPTSRFLAPPRSDAPSQRVHVSFESTQELTETLKTLERTLQKHMSVIKDVSSAEDQARPIVGSGLQGQQPTVPRATINRGRRHSHRFNDVHFESDTQQAPHIRRPDKVGIRDRQAVQSLCGFVLLLLIIVLDGNKDEHMVTVSVRIVFLKIGDIDTIRDRFQADVFIQARWKEPAMNGKKHVLNPSEIDWEQYWNPKLCIDNVFTDQMTISNENIWHSLHFDSHGCATVIEKRRLNTIFFEYMELNHFPFDSQDLTVTVSSDLEDDEVELYEDTEAKCALNCHSFCDEQEWRLHKSINIWKKTAVRRTQTTVHRNPTISVAAKASRRPGFFMWNIFLVMACICSMSFATFTIDFSLPHFRLQTSFILLLTTVTFKFVVNQNLPRIAYLTYMDKYILTSMAILCSICVWHAIIFKLSSTFQWTDAYSLYIDRIVLGLLMSAYGLFHALCVLFVACIVRKRRRMSDTEEEEEEVPEGLATRRMSKVVANGNGLNVDDWAINAIRRASLMPTPEMERRNSTPGNSNGFRE